MREDLVTALAIVVRRRLRQAAQVQVPQRGTAAGRQRLDGRRGDVQVAEEAEPLQAWAPGAMTCPL